MNFHWRRPPGTNMFQAICEDPISGGSIVAMGETPTEAAQNLEDFILETCGIEQVDRPSSINKPLFDYAKNCKKTKKDKKLSKKGSKR
jgi:hypothetical protein